MLMPLLSLSFIILLNGDDWTRESEVYNHAECLGAAQQLNIMNEHNVYIYINA